ncbi:ribonuclease J [Parapedomonas caeni]
MTPADELIFLALGGSGEIGMNVNLYGCQGKWVMVDLGMTFADPGTPGVELVLPDLDFIEKRAKNLLGIVLTHGHEDHIGAIPYLAAELKVPLYATPFTAGLIRHKLIEEGLEKEVKLKVIPMGGTFQLGPFGFTYVALAHSIPEGNAVVIDTPYGRIFHTGDWKLDDEPILGRPSTAEELTKFGDDGILALVGDSTNVFNRRESGSEGGVRDSLLKLAQGRKGRILVSTFASNAARLDTLGKVAVATGRHLCIAGRSLERIVRVAKETGYLKDFPPLVDLEDAERLPPQSVLIVATGCQGEPQAALSRIARGEHSHIRLGRGDLAILSSKNIPGNELGIGQVINQLTAREVTVITEKDAHVHVSGHPGQPELKAMYGWIRPKYAVPVHGELRHMAAHAAFARRCGVEKAIVQTNGDVVRLAPGEPAIIGKETVGRQVLDGDVIVPADGTTVVQRRRLAHNGYLSATLVLGRGGKLMHEPHIVVHGVPVENELDKFRRDCARVVHQTLDKVGVKDQERLAEQIRIAIRRLARDYTAKRPVAEVHILSV